MASKSSRKKRSPEAKLLLLHIDEKRRASYPAAYRADARCGGTVLQWLVAMNVVDE